VTPRSVRHRAAILASDLCGCYYCQQTFPPAAIEEWVDDGKTALCPKCGIDAVIGGAPTAEGLARLYRQWFGDGELVP
jgi:hypothetical protein